MIRIFKHFCSKEYNFSRDMIEYFILKTIFEIIFAQRQFSITYISEFLFAFNFSVNCGLKVPSNYWKRERCSYFAESHKFGFIDSTNLSKMRTFPVSQPLNFTCVYYNLKYISHRFASRTSYIIWRCYDDTIILLCFHYIYTRSKIHNVRYMYNIQLWVEYYAQNFLLLQKASFT